MDIGCAVGGASFELARAFPHVLGIDFSQHFVNAANVSEGGWGLVAVGQGEQLASSGLPQTVRPGDAHCSRPCWRCSLPFHRRPVPPQTMKEQGWMRYTAVEEGDRPLSFSPFLTRLCHALCSSADHEGAGLDAVHGGGGGRHNRGALGGGA